MPKNETEQEWSKNGARMEYLSTYKCRLCREEYIEGITSNETLIRTMSSELIVNGFSRQPLSPSLIGSHLCGDGSHGMSDFCGWKVVSNDAL